MTPQDESSGAAAGTDARVAPTAVDEPIAADRLILSHFTLARDHPLPDRFAAASAAGCVGVGLFAGQYLQLLGDGWSHGRLRDELDGHGLILDQVEALSGWGAARPDDRYVAFERFVWEMVAEFEVPYVQAIGPYDGSVADAADRYGALCDRAAEHGATVGLEFLPFTNIVDADAARAIVEAADRPNGGVCIDIWHHARGANDLAMLRRLPPELLVRVQMSDGPAAPTIADYKDDCLRYRVPPGQGEFEVDAVVDVVLDAWDENGIRPSWDLEVCNTEAQLGIASDHVTACADGMRAALARVRTARRPR